MSFVCLFVCWTVRLFVSLLVVYVFFCCSDDFNNDGTEAKRDDQAAIYQSKTDFEWLPEKAVDLDGDEEESHVEMPTDPKKPSKWKRFFINLYERFAYWILHFYEVTKEKGVGLGSKVRV